MTNADEHEILAKIFSLAQQYASSSDNKIVIKCRDEQGKLLFAYNSAPSKRIGKSRISSASKPKLFKPLQRQSRLVSTSSSDEGVTVAESESESSSEKETEDLHLLRNRVRHLCLERARADLFMPEMRNVPWNRLIAPGWPQGLPLHLDKPSPSIEEFYEIERRLARGDIQFFWK